MYCLMSTPTGPSPLSANVMIMLSLFLIVVMSSRWSGVRFVLVGLAVSVLVSAVVK